MHEWVRNKVFLQHIYYLTDDVLLQRNIWIISIQHEKVPISLVFRTPRGNEIKTRLENIAKNKAPLWYVAQCSQSSVGEKKEKETWKCDELQCNLL